MPAGHRASITGRSNPTQAACCTRSIITMKGANKAELRMWPFHAASPFFAAGADTPSAFLESCLACIAAHEADVGAFVHMNLDGAREAAARSTERWKAGKPLSKIDGMPVGIKDIVE